jgi:hypothetical protein
MGEGLLMKFLKIGNKGFSLVFSTATKIAREGMERMKIPGSYVIRGRTGVSVKMEELTDHNMGQRDEATMAPQINTDTSVSDLNYDYIEVFVDKTNYDPPDHMSLVTPECKVKYSGNCNTALAGKWDFVRITNVRNWPLGSPLHDSVMKEVSTIVLWEERGLTRSISLRTIVGRKDNDFY